MPALATEELENISCFNPLKLPSLLMFRFFGLSLTRGSSSGWLFFFQVDSWFVTLLFTTPIDVFVSFCHIPSCPWLFLFYLLEQVASGLSGTFPASDMELHIIHLILVPLNGKRHLKTTVWALNGFTAIGWSLVFLPSMKLVYRIFTWSYYLTSLFLPCQKSQFSRTWRVTELISPHLFLLQIPHTSLRIILTLLLTVWLLNAIQNFPAVIFLRGLYLTRDAQSYYCVLMSLCLMFWFNAHYSVVRVPNG